MYRDFVTWKHAIPVVVSLDADQTETKVVAISCFQHPKMALQKGNPVTDALRKAPGSVLFLDGGFATHLESLGQDIQDDLWSAKLLITNPSIITKAHYDYLCAGSNIIITSSYQASLKGLTSDPYNLSDQEAADKMTESVILAADAVRKYKEKEYDEWDINNDNIIIAASIGCFGAGLADGSEYTGYYGDGITERDLREYHSVKMHATNKTDNVVVMGCETIPNVMEVRVLTQLLNEYGYFGWITMACCNEQQLNSKEFVTDAIAEIMKYNIHSKVVGIGFNCTDPKYIDGLLTLTKRCLQEYEDNELVLMVYPNSGEEWDANTKTWKENTTMSDEEYAMHALRWYKMGARIIGGCCRTTPNTIKAIRKTILSAAKGDSFMNSKL